MTRNSIHLKHAAVLAAAVLIEQSTAATPTSVASGCGPTPTDLSLGPTVSMLNDPFTFLNGTKVSSKADFACRQQEYSAMLQQMELGPIPPKPSTLTATLSGNTLTINAAVAGKSISFKPTITYPSGSGPFPAIIAYDGLSIPTPSGVAVITFNNDQMAAQDSGSSRGQGLFYQLYGSGHAAGAMSAWAWGVSRIVDALELTNSTNKIKLSALGVSGCSRNGKGAFVAGAFEPRIALTIPQESGTGGAGCWRIDDQQLAAGFNTQTAHEIVNENVWFSENFNPYVNSITGLPFDHHFLAGLVAPRGLFVIENDIDWLGPVASLGCMTAGNMIYQAVGESDAMGFSQVGNHAHCAFPSSQQGDLNAYVQKFLFGQSTNTSIMKSDETWNQSQWIDWTVPTLS